MCTEYSEYPVYLVKKHQPVLFPGREVWLASHCRKVFLFCLCSDMIAEWSCFGVSQLQSFCIDVLWSCLCSSGTYMARSQQVAKRNAFFFYASIKISGVRFFCWLDSGTAGFINIYLYKKKSKWLHNIYSRLAFIYIFLNHVIALGYENYKTDGEKGWLKCHISAN